jgi:hypothetical protein
MSANPFTDIINAIVCSHELCGGVSGIPVDPEIGNKCESCAANFFAHVHYAMNCTCSYDRTTKPHHHLDKCASCRDSAVLRECLMAVSLYFAEKHAFLGVADYFASLLTYL